MLIEMRLELEDNGFSSKKIDTEEEFFSQLTKNTIAVLDGYHFDTYYQKKIKATGAKLVCIDDLHDKEFFADLIINHTPGITPRDYQAQPYTQLALGLDFVLLRPLFLKQAINQRIVEKIETIMICFGGSDFKNLTHRILQVVTEFSQFRKIIVVTGAAYKTTESIKQLLSSDLRIEHRHAQNEKQMLNSMLESDLAIVPARGILFEALASGCRLISGIYADNQKFVFTNFVLNNLIFNASDFNSIDTKIAIENALVSKYQSKSEIDGISSRRLKSCFYELISIIREATLNDCKLLFTWANDREVRKKSISKDQILWDNHVKWFNEKIISAKSKIFILEIEGNPVGQIRYDLKDCEWVIDYSISAEMRGKGLGKILVKLSLPYFEGQIIKALVIEDNIPSHNVFRTLGFYQTGTVKINSELYTEFKKTN